ncbi:hypothetical protein BH10PSE7_BH10PSE7_15260 [soil metagenome]
MSALVKYEAARAALSEAVRIDEVMAIRDESLHLALYARQAKDRGLMADAMEIQLRAERRLGELIGKAKEAGQVARGRPRQNGSAPEPFFRVRLSEAGIDKKLSMRAQQTAKLDDAHFAGVLERSREKIVSGAAIVVNPLRDLTQAEKKAHRETREAELGARQMALPGRKYGVIYADPEWRFEPYSRDSGMDRSPGNHYPTSDTLDIITRPVGEIAAADCVLFLWATAPMLTAALEVMKAWGFAYKSQVVWVKTIFTWRVKEGTSIHQEVDVIGSGDLAMGTGYWFRNAHELLLVGTRGAVPAPSPGDNWPSVIFAPVGAHSAKPAIFSEMIESYFPTLPKIELNRRGTARAGWDAWGNEAELPPHDPETGELLDEISAAAQGPADHAMVVDGSPEPASGMEAPPVEETPENAEAGEKDCNVSGLAGEGGQIPCRDGSLVSRHLSDAAATRQQADCHKVAGAPTSFTRDPPATLPDDDDTALPEFLDRSKWIDGKPPRPSESFLGKIARVIKETVHS